MRIGSIVVLSVFVAVAGCGSSGKTAPGAAPGGNDAGPAASGGDDTSGATDDAGPDPHSIYPAKHPPIPVITNHGGRVVKNPKVVTITFAGMDTTVRDYLRDFDAKIGATTYWSTVMDGYGVGPITSAGNYELPDVFSNTNTDDYAVQQWIATQVLQGTLPFPDDDTIYTIYMPSAATITLQGSQSCNSFGGYHNSGDLSEALVATNDAGVPSDGGGDEAGASDAGPSLLDAASPDGAVQRFVYAVNVECYANQGGASAQNIEDEETVTASHELAEVVTDPDVDSALLPTYYMDTNDAWAPGTRGGEVGDLCETGGSQVQEGAWVVQQIWNAKAAKASLNPCVPAPSSVNYGAVPHTVAPGLKGIGGASFNDGYVVAKKGQTTDVEVDVFSTAPLSGPLTIAAGAPNRGRGGTTDPTVMNAVENGVTMTLSQTTAQNGDRLTLHITVDPSAASTAGRRFSVRAVLSQTDYNSWPTLLYIP